MGPYPAMTFSFIKNFIFESCYHHTVLNLENMISNMRDTLIWAYRWYSFNSIIMVFLQLWVTVVLLCRGYVVFKFDHTVGSREQPFITAMALFIALHQIPWNYRPDLMVDSLLPQIICSKTDWKLLKEGNSVHSQDGCASGNGEGRGVRGAQILLNVYIKWGKSTFQAPYPSKASKNKMRWF